MALQSRNEDHNNQIFICNEISTAYKLATYMPSCKTLYPLAISKNEYKGKTLQ